MHHATAERADGNAAARQQARNPYNAPEPIAQAASGARFRLHFVLLPVCLLTLASCLWVLAYQLPLAQTIHVGGDTALARREDDRQFLFGENGSEPADRVDAPDDPRGYRWWFEELGRSGASPYRWMSGDATIVVPGAGGGPYLMELRAQSGRPDNLPAPSVWTPGPLAPFALTLAPGTARRYQLLVPTLPGGELRLRLRTEPYVSPNDPRELGFVLHQVRLRDLGSVPRAPAWPTLGLLGIAVATIYGIALALRVGPLGSAGLAGAAALAAAAALAFTRPALTSFTPALAGLALACAVLGLLAWAIAQGSPAGYRVEVAHGLALVLLAFALRMGGMLHPQAMFSDLGFHAGKLFQATLSGVYLTAPLPAEAGGGQSPYPPGFYLMLLPGQLLAPLDGARRLLIQGGAALFDSLAIVLIWALIRRAGFGPRAAALGAACYLLPTPALESFSIGEYANLGGQALALPLLALLGLGALTATPSRRLAPARLALLSVAVALGLLGHSGVTLSVGAAVGAAWLLAWLWRRGQAPLDPVVLTIGAAAGLAAALLLFYSAPVYLELFAARTDNSAGGGRPAIDVLLITIRALLGIAPPHDTRVALPLLIGPLGLIGLALLLVRPTRANAPLRAWLVAIWVGTLFTLSMLVVAGLGVRWAIFLYPALGVGAGVALEALWRRGHLGRLAALAVLAVIIGGGLLAWVVQIRDYPRI